MKRLALLLLILSGCNAVAQTPKPTMNLETAVFILTATGAPIQPTLTPRPTYTPLPTATDYPTYATLTPRPLPTRTPAPELFRMLERPLPVMNGSTAIMQVWCHFQYNYWIVRPYEMIFYRLDLDGLKETWCFTHNGRLQ